MAAVSHPEISTGSAIGQVFRFSGKPREKLAEIQSIWFVYQLRR
jgi:hypothetical protein